MDACNDEMFNIFMTVGGDQLTKWVGVANVYVAIFVIVIIVTSISIVVHLYIFHIMIAIAIKKINLSPIPTKI